MAEHGYNLLNTGMIQKAVAKRDEILQKYDKIKLQWEVKLCGFTLSLQLSF